MRGNRSEKQRLIQISICDTDMTRGSRLEETLSEIDGWPPIRLSRVSFKPPLQHLARERLAETFRKDAEAYFARRQSGCLR
jgi:hypothetical protein